MKNYESDYFFSKFNPNPNIRVHNELAQTISNYLSWVTMANNKKRVTSSMCDYFNSNNIPTKEPMFCHTAMSDFEFNHDEFYSEEEKQLAREIVNTKQPRKILRNIYSNKCAQLFVFDKSANDATSIKQ